MKSNASQFVAIKTSNIHKKFTKDRMLYVYGSIVEYGIYIVCGRSFISLVDIE